VKNLPETYTPKPRRAVLVTFYAARDFLVHRRNLMFFKKSDAKRALEEKKRVRRKAG
jgi:hypothetical protein